MTCPSTYIDIPDFDRTKDVNGPFGTMNASYVNIHKGKCWTDSDHFSSDDVKKLGHCALDAFDGHVAANFLWTAHNQIDAKWDFQRAYKAGWLNRDAEFADCSDSIFDVHPKYIYQEPAMQFLN